MKIPALDRNYSTPHFAQNSNTHKISPDNKLSQQFIKSVGASALLGASAAGIATYVIKETTRNRYTKASIIGGLTMVASMLLTYQPKRQVEGNKQVKK